MRTPTESLPTPPPGVKYIPLTQGKFVTIDEEDFDRVSHLKWHFNTGYAVSTFKQGAILMHRLIMGVGKGIAINHKNLNRLDNRKENLRVATASQNSKNVRLHRDNKSGFKGVSWHKQGQKFRAVIWDGKKQINLGLFKTAEEAAEARRSAEIKIHGEFAQIH